MWLFSSGFSPRNAIVFRKWRRVKMVTDVVRLNSVSMVVGAITNVNWMN